VMFCKLKWSFWLIASQQSVWCRLAWRTTFGRWGRWGRADLAPRFTTTGLEVATLGTRSTRTTLTSWKSGTWSSFSLTGTVKPVI
jgi:hypothetical protein